MRPLLTGHLWRGSSLGLTRSWLLLAVTVLALFSGMWLVPGNVAQVLFLRGLALDPASLLSTRQLLAGFLGWQAPVQSAQLSCRVELAIGDEAAARRMCAGLPVADVRVLVHAVDVASAQGNLPNAPALYRLLGELYPTVALLSYRLAQVSAPGQSTTVDALQQAVRLTEDGDTSLWRWELVDVHALLAQNYLWWQAYDDALQATAAALQVETNARTLRLQALAYAQLGRFPEAEQSIQAAVAQDASGWPQLEWGDIERLADRPAQAELHYKLFLDAMPVTDRGQGYRRLCELWLARADALALAPCRQLTATAAPTAEQLLLLGDAQRLADDSHGAATSYRAALELDPQNPDAQARLQALETSQ